MTTIFSIQLKVGAGSVGIVFASRLPSPDVLVSVVARSDYEELSTKLNSTYTVKSKVFGEYKFRPEGVYPTVEAAGKAHQFDYILLGTKSLPTIDSAELIAPAVTANKTTVIFLQNGIGNERSTAKKFGNTLSIGTSVVNVASDRESAGVVNHYQDGRLRLGPYTGEGDFPEAERPGLRADTADRLKWITERWNAAQVPVIYTDDVLPFVWSKVAGNNGFNPTTTLAGCCTPKVLASPNNPAGRALVIAIQEEVYSVAKAYLGDRWPPPGVPLGEAGVDAFLKVLSDDFRSSMSQDFMAQRDCEVEAIVGEVVRRAKAKGIAVPRIETTYALMSGAMAEMVKARDGKAQTGTLGR